jgi:hypothetical protein
MERYIERITSYEDQKYEKYSVSSDCTSYQTIDQDDYDLEWDIKYN